eukprot:UN02961
MCRIHLGCIAASIRKTRFVIVADDTPTRLRFSFSSFSFSCFFFCWKKSLQALFMWKKENYVNFWPENIMLL